MVWPELSECFEHQHGREDLRVFGHSHDIAIIIGYTDIGYFCAGWPVGFYVFPKRLNLALLAFNCDIDHGAPFSIQF